MGFSDCYTFNTREGLEFIRSQFTRFGLDCPPDELLSGVFVDVFRIFDCFDPYMWFEFTDVTATDEWRNNTFDVIDSEGQIFEAAPEDFDHFRFIKGREQENFDDMMGNPGLQHPNFNYIDHYIDEMFDYDNMPYNESIVCRHGEESRVWLEARVQPDMDVPPYNKDIFKCLYKDDKKAKGYLSISDLNNLLKGKEIEKIPLNDVLSPKNRPVVEALVHNWKQQETMLDYARLAIWASFVWMISPMAHEFRRSMYDIFDAVYADGECIFFDGSVYPKKNYKISARSPASCTECGINGWCISQVNILGVNRHQCEFHVNGDLPKIAPVNCGTLFCKAVECIHHPYRGMKDAKLIVHREGGAIMQKIRSNQMSLGYRLPTAGFLN